MTNDVVSRTAASVSKALERLYKAGGFALAFGFGGLLLILVASFSTSKLQAPTFAAGCILTLICLFFFLITNLRPRQVAQRVKDDQPLLDALQSAALNATELASLIQSLAFKHLSKMQKALETVGPLIEAVPFVGAAAKKAGLTDSAKVSGIIVSATENTKEVVTNLQSAIKSGDVKAIKMYTSNLEDALDNLKKALQSVS